MYKKILRDLSKLNPLCDVFKNEYFREKKLQKAKKLSIFLLALFIQIFVPKTAARCNFDQFMCKDDGKCIPQAKLCNGRLDCSDNSDEIDCDLKMCRKPEWFQCTSPYGPCLSSALICNGIENCPDGEDEFECVSRERGLSKDYGTGGWHSLQRNCSQYEYTCQSDRSCIPINFMCDGNKNCHDGSDETIGCVAAEAKCKGFFCRNKRCLESKKWLCDGVDDCGDGSDEMNCAGVFCTVEMGKFLCHNNLTCLPLEKVCDGKADCPDHSDESSRCTASNNCTINTCPPASKCQMMPYSSPKCICPKGFRHSLVDDVCIDINECLEKFGACSQTCVNLPGTYKCLCDEGYSLREDNRTCEAYGEEALLLYTTQVAVTAINLRSKRVYTVAKNLTKVIGVSYNGEHIYWTNIENEDESIVKANPDGTQPEILLTSGLDAPEDLAVDWLTGNIYFSDNVMHHIAVCSNDGHFCAVLVTENVHQPRGVALWPQRSQIFWTDWGIWPMIVRASMDGTNSMPLVTEKIHWPNGIALDMHNDRVYWVDAKFATIECVRSDGTDRRTVLEEILKHPYGLAIFEDSIYWSDWGTKSIHSCNKFTGKNHRVITKDRTIYAVHVYHSSKQKAIDHACVRFRCSHLCLLAENNSFSCACPDGMQLGPDQLRCTKTHKKQRLFLGVGSNLLEMEHTTFGRHSITSTHKLDMLMHELAYNSVNNSVFAVDNYRRRIFEVDLQSNTISILVKENLGNVTTLAFDDLSHNLYWTDSERHVVEVLSLKTKHRAIVSFFSGMEKPIGLAIVPVDGMMFVALRSRRHVHIDQILLNGLGKHSHVFEDELGDNDIKFAVDFKTNSLYWSDSDLGRISFSDYRNLHAYTFRGRLKRPYSLAIVGEDLFWSEIKSNTIHWTHKSNLGPLKRFDIEVNREIYGVHVLPVHIPLTASSPFSKTDHPCQHWNGGCSHICVSLGKSLAGCVCPAGLVFGDATNRSCVEALDCEFRCRSGECLSMSRRCNSRKDCSDNSDEEGCEAELNQKSKVVCSVGKFMCHNAEQCLETDERCDGKKQCTDGSDEEHCESFDKTKLCHRHQHVCDNGICVDFSVMCDGRNDCGDNSDELNCQVAIGRNVSLRPFCDTNMFQCNTGTCIAKSWECDGKIDCSDASDEHVKCGIRECPNNMHRCLLGQCIDKRLVCDGHNDCGDLTDELNCDASSHGRKKDIFCAEDRMYQCPTNPNMCFEPIARCNGTAECPRGEDEADCDNICTIYEYHCKTSKECIRAEFRCDKEKDCADGSDEENCSKYSAWNVSLTVHTHEQPCGPKMWSCRNGQCVDESRVCDGIDDCDTGADEGPLCKTACKPINGKPPCDNKCKATPAGAICSCFNGYKLDSDHRSCFDINECEEQDPCSQVCENTLGSYRCSCYPDFMMRPDKTTCKSIEREKSLLFSTYDEVRSITEQPIILKIAWKANDSKINSFDLNVRTRQAYFTTENQNIVYRVDVDKGEINGALVIPMPGKLAVDWITDNVYVISRSKIHEIQICSFSAKMCGVILNAKIHESIETIAVDAYSRRLFFVIVQSQTYGSHRSRIVSTTLDGNKKKILVMKDESFITALACDPYKKFIYYTDLHRKILQGINYGSKSKVLPITIIKKRNIILYPSGLTWYENQIFIVNLGAKEATRCYLYGSKTCKAFNLNILNAKDVLVDGTSRQPMNRNPCDMAKCRGMCIQSEFSFKCMCGSSIVSENKPCDATNEINFSSFLKHREYSSHKYQESSHIAPIIWILAILLLLLACGLGYIFYRRKQQNQRNFIRNLHFQNPLASFLSPYDYKTDTMDSDLLSTRTGSSSGTTAASFEIEREKLPIGSPIQKLLKKSTISHGHEISLEMAKPHEPIQKLGRNKEQLRLEQPLIPNLLVEDDGNDIELPAGDYDDNARTKLLS